jgi:predicted CoA-binding protein
MTHTNPSDEALRELLTSARTIAVVGASSKPDRPSYGIMQILLRAGFHVIPVSPRETEVLGQRAYPSLGEVPERVDIVDVFRRAEDTPAVADEAVRIGARALWLQLGIVSEEAAARASAGGLTVVLDRCIGQTVKRLTITRAAGETMPLNPLLQTLFSELVDGANASGATFTLNADDPGLLRSLEKLSAEDASRSSNAGATIAAHAQHLRYGLSLMNRWAQGDANPFANARWDEAWRTHAVDDAQWSEIRNGLADEAHRWLAALGTPRVTSDVELGGMIGSITHLAYHLGAIRQIAKQARGPREVMLGD